MGQETLQIGAAKGISNRGKKITNRGRDFKSGQRLQIGARETINWGRDFKSVQSSNIFLYFQSEVFLMSTQIVQKCLREYFRKSYVIDRKLIASSSVLEFFDSKYIFE